MKKKNHDSPETRIKSRDFMPHKKIDNNEGANLLIILKIKMWYLCVSDYFIFGFLLTRSCNKTIRESR